MVVIFLSVWAQARVEQGKLWPSIPSELCHVLRSYSHGCHPDQTVLVTQRSHFSRLHWILHRPLSHRLNWWFYYFILKKNWSNFITFKISNKIPLGWVKRQCPVMDPWKCLSRLNKQIFPSFLNILKSPSPAHFDLHRNDSLWSSIFFSSGCNYISFSCCYFICQQVAKLKFSKWTVSKLTKVPFILKVIP